MSRHPLKRREVALKASVFRVTSQVSKGIPRASGGEPVGRATTVHDAEYSPRERG